MDNVIRQIRRMAGRPLGTQNDEELLNEFFAGADDEAFTALVRRHGAMVLGVCLRLLHNRQDAEDAFQATFLTLVRKGHLIRHRGALSSWLYRVAFRVALRLKAKADKSRTDILTEVAVNADPGDEIAWRELRPVLDTEVNRLPAKYRAPIVLCYLEGKTYEEAAGQLGCPKGTVAIRLLRGKVLLKNRLARRGLMLSAGLVAANAALPQALAAVPPTLQTVTASAGAAVAAGSALSAVAPTAVVGLVRAVAHDMWARKLRTAAVVFFGLALTGVGIGTVAAPNPVLRTHEVAAAVTTTPATPKPPAQPDPQPQLTPAAKLQPELPPKPADEPPAQQNANRSYLVIDCSSRGAALSDEDADHLIRRWCINGRSETHIYIRTGRSPTDKRSPAGLALRDHLMDDAMSLPCVPQAVQNKNLQIRTAFVYRIKLKNGSEVHVIVINPA